MQSRYCPRCSTSKDEDQFYLVRGKPGGYCKPCAISYSAEYDRGRTDDDYRARKRKAKEEYRARLKKKVYDHYGHTCSCCTETEPAFLSIDHMNNDGYAHRKIIGSAGDTFLRWLVDNGFPDEFQVLCMNCNVGKYRNGGTCPHAK